jgi:hypothetical protein
MQKTVANAHDSAFEANLRRTTHNLYVQLAYTWSKSIDQSSSLAEALYPGNAGLSSAISAFDMTHNFSATYRYELPLVRLAPGKPKASARLAGLRPDALRHRASRNAGE